MLSKASQNENPLRIIIFQIQTKPDCSEVSKLDKKSQSDQ